MTFITTSGITSSVTGSIGTGSVVTYHIVDSTPSHTEIKMVAEKKEEKIINPALYFRLIKSKLTTLEQDKLKRRLKALYKHVRELEEMGQQAAFEAFAAQLSLVVRESEAVACGYSTFVQKKHIDKLINAGFFYQNMKNTVYFKKLEDFPRLIPDDVKKKIKDVQEKKLFDELWIIYLDYTKEELKTTKEKIREKDPILFGKFAVNDERYYFIADWVDEKCHLTMKAMIDELEAIAEAQDDVKFDEKVENDVEDIDLEYVKRLSNYTKEQVGRLKSTNNGNFRQFIEDEEKAKEELRNEAQRTNDQKLEEQIKKPWWKLW